MRYSILPFFVVVALLFLGHSVYAGWSVSVTSGLTVNHASFHNEGIFDKLKKLRLAIDCELDPRRRKLIPISEGFGPGGMLPPGYWIEGTDRCFDTGFGFVNQETGLRDMSVIDSVMNEVNKRLCNVVNDLFPADEFVVGPSPIFKADPNVRIVDDDIAYYPAFSWPPLTLRSLNYPDFNINILNGSYEKRGILSWALISPETLQFAFKEYVTPDYNEINRKWEEASSAHSTNRCGATVGFALSYDHVFKSSSACNGFIGIDSFFEFTPRALKTDRFSISEQELGIRPKIGIEIFSKCRVFALVGVKTTSRKIRDLSSRSLKTCSSRRCAYELGIGSEYIISNISLGMKLIKTLKVKYKIGTSSMTVSSTKALLSLSHRL